MSFKIYDNLAYENTNDFIYEFAKNLLRCKNGMVIGRGTIYPELNFTFPEMLITQETMPEVIKQYKEIIEDSCKRAQELYVPAFVSEVELLPPTTYNPEWGNRNHKSGS